ncbi:Translation protein SH3-like domain superfamily [Sesbania bispinosa]|nr:Translation protein SH3-like domain superfamily [Sesbania bispinosa]
MAPKQSTRKVSRNPELIRGIRKYSRSQMYHKRGIWAIKAKNGGVLPRHDPKPKPEAPAEKPPKFYPADDVKKPLINKHKPKPAKLRASITPGTVLILLAGRFKGKRVVFLKQLPSGLLLVTGPFKINGVPLRRVNQSYVIGTSTKVDVSAVNVDKFDDKYFAKEAQKKKKGEGEFFEAEKEEKNVLPQEKKDDQKTVDSALVKAIESVPDLKAYLGASIELGPNRSSVCQLLDNNFSGLIPSSVSPRLIALDLSFNSFSGSIPPAFQNLRRLIWLYLQNNSISGTIPNFNLPCLKHLNLSYNNLNGSIPNSIKTFPYSSFLGNSLLCGPPLNHFSTISPSPSPSSSHQPLSPATTQNQKAAATHKKSFGLAERHLVLGKTEVSKSFGSGVQTAEKDKLFFFEGSSYSFDLEDLPKASAEVLGKGSCGTAYKAVLEEGTTVVVKRLKEVLGS